MEYDNLIVPIEYWKPIIIIDNILPYYSISTFGRIFSSFSNKILTDFEDGSGYKSIRLRTTDGSRNFRIHRLLLLTFNPISNPEQFDINHKDGIKTNNYIGNLEWCTTKENIDHAIRTGLIPVGEKSGKTVVTDNEVHLICKLLSQQKSYKDIILELSKIREIPDKIYTIIYHIHHRLNWNHISKNYAFYKYDNNRNGFTDDEAYIICNMFQNGIFNYKEILKTLGYNLSSMDEKEIIRLRTNISNIRNGKNYKHISSKFTFNNERSVQKFTTDQVHLICRCLENKMSAKEIAPLLNIDVDNMNAKELANYRSNISAIKTRTNYANISKSYNF